MQPRRDARGPDEAALRRALALNRSMTMTGRVLASRYRLLEVIGQGGMAVVCTSDLAQRAYLSRSAALMSTAWAAARRATGTRNGEHDT